MKPAESSPPPVSFARQVRKRRRQAGFTLTELLVVIAIILVMVGIASTLLMRSPNQGVALQAAVSQVSTLFQNARELALTRNTTSMVLVANDSTNKAQYRRFVKVVYQDPNSPTSNWVAADRGMTLPQGVYFDKDNATSGAIQPKGVDASYNIGGTAWYGYAFSANGICTEAGARFVVVAGVPSSASPDPIIPNAAMLRGFVVRRLGSVVFFDTMSQVQ